MVDEMSEEDSFYEGSYHCEKKSRNANSDTKNVEPRPKCEFDEREHKNTDIMDVPISDISFLIIEKNKEKRTKPKCESDAREQTDISKIFLIVSH
jgi:hypothetical protein